MLTESIAFFDDDFSIHQNLLIEWVGEGYIEALSFVNPQRK